MKCPLYPALDTDKNHVFLCFLSHLGIYLLFEAWQGQLCFKKSQSPYTQTHSPTGCPLTTRFGILESTALLSNLSGAASLFLETSGPQTHPETGFAGQG